MTTRLIHRTAASPSRDLGECMEGLLLSEILNPGRRLLVVSPWMSDFPSMDNSAGKFSVLEPSWTASVIPFSGVIRALLLRGTEVRIACGPGSRETDFLGKIEQGAILDGTTTKLSISRLPNEHRVFSHEKALIADTWAVFGSMNFTYSGVSMNGELITVTTDPTVIGVVATELRGLFK